MTGFGRSIVEYNHNKIIAEVKSLNSKQFDLLMRVPGYYRELEPELRSVLAEQLQRGKVDLTITLENLGEASVVLNVEAMEHYKRQIEDMCTRLNIAWPTDWVGQLMRMPDAMKSEVRLLSDSERNIVKGAVVKAAHALTDFRRTEGAKLEVFFADKIRRIGELLSEVEPFENSRVAKLRERLEAQLQKLQGVEIDAGRLEQELIYYIEKLDVTEEKTRLRAHLNYFTETMAGEPGQGKKLGFIAQEMGREINTLGSKSNNAEMQRIVVKMKDELEQIKEQVLNVL
ncbi:MAG: YicC family protein [Muribaculaceae bacterium]|nr:YicC family protein [Muribaculaceae bacterium]